ncbi:hypothetical protein, partial [Aeromonas caviae]|uniref:hypothetical protein n=1 Tax=Aeromonas caviae TaxID=648 RepID=UPI002B46D321
GDGGDQITKSSVSSIQAASIWATTPHNVLNESTHHRLNGIEENAQLPPSQGDRYPISKFRVALFEDKGKNFSILSSRELKLKPAVPSASYTSPML